MHRRARSQEGFTLVELLISMTVSGIIMAAVVSAVYVGIRTTTGAQRGLDQSNAQQVIAHYFAADIQAACDPALISPTCTRTPNPSITSVSACGSTAVFAMDSVSTAAAAAANTTVGYVLTGTTFQRVSCALGAGAASSTITLAANVAGAVVSAGSGSCSGELQLALTVSGTTLGNGTPDYNLTFCARRRA